MGQGTSSGKNTGNATQMTPTALYRADMARSVISRAKWQEANGTAGLSEAKGVEAINVPGYGGAYVRRDTDQNGRTVFIGLVWDEDRNESTVNGGQIFTNPRTAREETKKALVRFVTR